MCQRSHIHLTLNSCKETVHKQLKGGKMAENVIKYCKLICVYYMNKVNTDENGDCISAW